jgi:hypothetical protein
MTRRARAAAVVLSLIGAASACATSNEAGGGYPGGDASTEARAHDDSGSGGPSPDAIVLGDDSTAPPDEAGADAEDELPITGKSCTGLADGTPCAPAPDFCHDTAVCMSGTCAAPAAKADGVACGKAPDSCHLAPVCMSGACAAAANAKDGTVCGAAPNACHDAPACSAGKCGTAGLKPDGFQWSSDATAMCCSGNEAHQSDNDNCGVCGIKCNAGNGESCSVLGGRYFCRGCVASSACWSGCCSTSFSPYSCAASDCAGNLCPGCCPAGTHAVSGGGTSSDYCSY